MDERKDVKDQRDQKDKGTENEKWGMAGLIWLDLVGFGCGRMGSARFEGVLFFDRINKIEKMDRIGETLAVSLV